MRVNAPERSPISAGQAIILKPEGPEGRGGMRICISGSPKAGKTTLANSFAAIDSHCRHTDELKDLPWSEQSERVVEWLDEAAGCGNSHVWLLEGCAVIRGLRKWLLANPKGKPCDVLIWLQCPQQELTPNQDVLRKGCDTIFLKIMDKLRERGVRILIEVNV